jgi:hypothetical protein
VRCGANPGSPYPVRGLMRIFVSITHTFSEIIAAVETLRGDFAVLLTRGALDVVDCTPDRMLYIKFQRRVYQQCEMWTRR